MGASFFSLSREMKIGIIGLSGSGKTTIFETLIRESGGDVNHGTYGEERLKPHLGAVEVKDARLAELAARFGSKKITFPELVFVDRPGLDLAHAKESDALLVVIGMFLGRDPLKDIKDVETELLISDLGIVQNTLKRLEKELKGGTKKEGERERDLLVKANGLLEAGTSLRTMELDEHDAKLLSGFQFLTQKPMVVVLNVHESDIEKAPPGDAVAHLSERDVKFVEFCAKIELEIQELDAAERSEFLKSLGIETSALDQLVKSALDVLRLVTFFTVKGDEARAWLVRQNTKAVNAAGKIHSDMERGFIRAEVVRYTDFIECGGSLQEVKKRGLCRLEGRDYIVKDGDILDIRFNV
jgi:hypothetical protein